MDLRADFLLTQDVDGETGFLSPCLETLPKDYLDDEWNAKWVEYLDLFKGYEMQAPRALLFYRLLNASALPLACKQVYIEAKQELQLLRDCVKGNIHHDRIAASPDATFLDICSKSRFIFHSNGWRTFLARLPQVMKLQIRRIVIAPNHTGQEVDAPLVSYLFETMLCSFPHLREVSLMIERRGNLGLSTRREAAEFRDMLKNEYIDIVRFMFRVQVSSPTHLCPHLHEIYMQNSKGMWRRECNPDDHDWKPGALCHAFEAQADTSRENDIRELIGVKMALKLTRRETGKGMIKSVTDRDFRKLFSGTQNQIQ